MLTTTSSANVSKCVDSHLKVVSYHTAPSKVSQETPPVWARQFPCKDGMSRHSRIVWLVGWLNWSPTSSTLFMRLLTVSIVLFKQARNLIKLSMDSGHWAVKLGQEGSSLLSL